jgi:hypothetical protein
LKQERHRLPHKKQTIARQARYGLCLEPRLSELGISQTALQSCSANLLVFWIGKKQAQRNVGNMRKFITLLLSVAFLSNAGAETFGLEKTPKAGPV